MARAKQKRRAASYGRGKRETAPVSQVANAEQPIAEISQVADSRTSGPKWPNWLNKITPEPRSAETQQNTAEAQAAFPEPVVDHQPVVALASPEFIEESLSPSGDRKEYARPSVLDAASLAENIKLATDMKKESQMQTAKQSAPRTPADTAEKIDLRDRMPAKDNVSRKAPEICTDGMASLFGPEIEDEVKGVRSQIREIIQGELQGELGQRFSRNLRIVIRREIAAAVDDQFDRL